ncbi:LOW QUALITY PROTEIN: Helitron helicase-like protein [Phytophthora palmivora]|uniref:ATP-dependent DNA helicase n=1 Tax=Phytophthora palmivora TaxID=4796 RepID=A0A2P4XAC2_9STRA|nr:LOW QUALITY PROTEIN: Helitron helicase-like protein [Phytophthora palmivora]
MIKLLELSINQKSVRDCPLSMGLEGLGIHIASQHTCTRLDSKIAIAVASSGIASLLQLGRRTAHSTCKIPLRLDENLTCSIYKQSHLRKSIEKAHLVVWDEAPMTHRHASTSRKKGMLAETIDIVYIMETLHTIFRFCVGEGRHDVNPTLGSKYMKILRDMVTDNPPDEIEEDPEIIPRA